MLYRWETWIVARDEMRKIEAFEMWCYRRTEKISWIDRITNEEILDRVSEKINMEEYTEKAE